MASQTIAVWHEIGVRVSPSLTPGILAQQCSQCMAPLSSVASCTYTDVLGQAHLHGSSEDSLKGDMNHGIEEPPVNGTCSPPTSFWWSKWPTKAKPRALGSAGAPSTDSRQIQMGFRLVKT
ncbi:hypothetical protein GRJ2_002517600 [Grus japonensis]|uniref:Uncharacterized protein n=1 Tax=Grus japonensis TaxID=30415 RepID=A0ABC9XSX4_GRUJA